MNKFHYPSFWSRMAQLEDDVGIPAWLRDKQERSRATRERILDAAATLIEQGSYAGISMQDLADEAGVSIGAVYARFPSKESILVLLGVVVFDGVCTSFLRALEGLPGTAGLAGVVEAYVATLVEALTRHRPLVIEMRRQAGGAPDVRSLMDHTNRAIHEAFYGRAREHLSEINHPAPETALRYALFMTNAAAREAILAGVLTYYALDGGAEELIRELTQAACAYLGVTPPDDGSVA